MKKVLSLLLIFALVMSMAACGGKKEESTTTPAVPESTTKATEATTEEPTSSSQAEDEMVYVEGRQAYYEELFKSKKIEYAGPSTSILSMTEDGMMLVDHEVEGSNYALHMHNQDNVGYSLYNIGGKHYYLFSSPDDDGNIAKNLYTPDTEDDEMFNDDSQDMSLDFDNTEYGVTYVGTYGSGVEEVKLLIKSDGEEREVLVTFNKDGQLNVMEYNTDTAEMNVVFYETEGLELPEDMEIQTASQQDLGMMLLLIMYYMAGGDGESEDPSGRVEFNDQYLLNGEVILDTDYTCITLTEIAYEAYYGLRINMTVENKAEVERYLMLDECYIDDYYSFDFASETVAPGEVMEASLFVSEDLFDDLGVDVIEKIAFLYTAIDNENYEAETNEKVVVEFYPTAVGEKDFVTPERKVSDNELILLDDKDYSVVLLEIEEDEYFGDETILAYVENRSEKMVDIYFEDETLNGVQTQTYTGQTLIPGGRAYLTISFYFEDSDDPIDIETYEGVLRIYDNENDDYDEVLSELGFSYNDYK